MTEIEKLIEEHKKSCKDGVIDSQNTLLENTEDIKIKEEIKNGLREIRKAYGDKNVIKKSIEELAELQIALLKNDSCNIEEEICDVYNMLFQLQEVFNINNHDMNDYRLGKIKRQFKRMKNINNDSKECCNNFKDCKNCPYRDC